jgi:UDP-N-acetylmuramoyl-L-alanyl-D-glutamate--2,6-diaminopimelate ligase
MSEPADAWVRPSPRPVALADVCSALGIQPPTDTTGNAPPYKDVTVTGVTLDSRSVQSGDVFAALPGMRSHGADFVGEAQTRGAVAVFTDEAGASSTRKQCGDDLAVVVVADPRSLVGEFAAAIYHRPADSLLMFGVTGTNGKTTTTYLLQAGLQQAGHVTGIIGTVATMIGDQVVGTTVRTTPEAPELHALLAVMVERGVTAVAMEVSSHALAQGRVDGCCFTVAGFTQLGSDHLDFHGTQQNYMAAKASLFTPAHSERAVITIDDEGGREMASRSSVPTVTLSVGGLPVRGQPATWTVTGWELRPEGGYDYQLENEDGSRHAGAVSLIGAFNVSNAALAQAMLLEAGLDASTVGRGIANATGVPGRMERIADDDVTLLVDYAHTEEALARALTAVRPIAEVESGRVLVVFGCGGDRDRNKRSRMGVVAAQNADVVVVTDDNPRSEPPESIRAAVLDGAREAMREGVELHDIGDRARAIEWAVKHAHPGDVVLVAGKGHETGQEADGVVRPFDDRVQVARAARSTRSHQ